MYRGRMWYERDSSSAGETETDENMSPGDSSDSSDGEGPEMDLKEEAPSMTIASKSINSSQPHSTGSASTVTTSASVTASSKNQQPTASTAASTQAASILPPLVYQTAQGMMYATPSNGSVIFSLAQADPNLGHAQQLIIPLSVMTANGQGELDLSKRK
ncbi:hypothetical protein MML48_7g00014809 [Holotrichia oblita]|uniref:Uncharacterized protein n=1 Tax=Holotrichia oblita TaxID=644536 RepID=A0ACB9SRU0_HOLOL|nr:hypothetical protein MML48_7g00014809 [Holotrichia oblita]